MATRDRPSAHRPAGMEGAAARSRRREEHTRGAPLGSRADGGQPHCPQQQPNSRMPLHEAFLRCPPAGSRRDAARREAKDPAPPPGAAGTKAAHAPGNPTNHTGAGKMTPATRGTGATSAKESDDRGSTGFIADPGPPKHRGRRGKPAREEGPEGRPGRDRQETDTGPG